MKKKKFKNKDYAVVHSHVISSYSYRPHALLKIGVTLLTIAVVIAVLIVCCRWKIQRSNQSEEVNYKNNIAFRILYTLCVFSDERGCISGNLMVLPDYDIWLWSIMLWQYKIQKLVDIGCRQYLKLCILLHFYRHLSNGKMGMVF